MRVGPGLTIVLIVLLVLLLAALVVAIVLGIRLLRLWSVVSSPDMPAAGKVAFWAAIAYALFPIDVLPDPVYLDDAGVLALATAVIGSLARRHGITADRPRPRGGAGGPGARGTQDG